MFWARKIKSAKGSSNSARADAWFQREGASPGLRVSGLWLALRVVIEKHTRVDKVAQHTGLWLDYNWCAIANFGVDVFDVIVGHRNAARRPIGIKACGIQRGK